MAGGTIQLIAYGAQDVYLTSEPQITFFKMVYRRYTHFSIETFENVFFNNPNFGEKGRILINKNGDLMTHMFLKIIINSVDPGNSKFAWTNRLGYAIINSIDIEIGGVKIDKHYGTWLNIWYELSKNGYHDRGHDILIGDVPELTELNNNIKPEYTLYIPLQFWFNKLSGLAIPVVALQYHDTYINIQYSKVNNLFVSDCNYLGINNLTIQQSSLLIDYIYLDTIERKRLVSLSHEYLVDQLQFTGIEPIDNEYIRYELDFNRPLKELIWIIRDAKFMTSRQYMYYTHDKNKWNNIIEQFALNIANNSIVVKEIHVVDNIIVSVDPKYNLWIILDNDVDNTGTPAPVGLNEFIIHNYIITTPKPADFNPLIFNPPVNYRVMINPNSVLIGEYNISSKIFINVIVDEHGNFNSVIGSSIIEYHELTIKDISFELNKYTFDLDQQIYDEPICVNQFNNYGMYLDGTGNPCEYAKLMYNERDRFDKRERCFYELLQPYMHHNSIPNSINVYSFAIRPEEYQPSGTSNISAIDNVIFHIWLGDPITSSKYDNSPKMSPIDLESEFYMFSTNYNIFRISNGLGGLSYTP
jgi:hypothetical protein